MLSARILALLLSRYRGSDKKVELSSIERAIGNSGSIERFLFDGNGLEGLADLRKALTDRVAQVEATGRLNEWHASGIGTIPIFDQHYPPLLRLIYNPPWILFSRGCLDSLSQIRPMVAVVGSRSARPASCETANEIAAELARGGACVVSGLAVGVDAAAHRGALSTGVRAATIAVLGSGLYEIYPACNRGLADEIIANGGLIISQFEPSERPYPSNFLARNRIIAGLSQAVVVVQAADRSGSLVTARFALEEGRDVLALPGGMGDTAFRGSNRLIKEGAYLLGDLAELYEFIPDLRCGSNAPVESQSELSPAKKQILEYLAADLQVHQDKLETDLARVENLSVHLLELEIEQVIQRRPGNFFALTTRI